MGNPDSGLGCDYSGTVMSVGSGVTRWKEGDRVCGFVHGGKFKDKGSFAEYLVVKENIAIATPDSLEDAEAATYGVGYCTAGMVSQASSAILSYS